jgi:polyvinyl alcohol dehydrogenase (cytochrome)
MFALDAATGQILWRFSAGSSVNSGPAVADGSVYWGAWYSRSGIEGSGSNSFYAFTRAPTTAAVESRRRLCSGCR